MSLPKTPDRPLGATRVPVLQDKITSLVSEKTKAEANLAALGTPEAGTYAWQAGADVDTYLEKSRSTDTSEGSTYSYYENLSNEQPDRFFKESLGFTNTGDDENPVQLEQFRITEKVTTPGSSSWVWTPGDDPSSGQRAELESAISGFDTQISAANTELGNYDLDEIERYNTTYGAKRTDTPVGRKRTRLGGRNLGRSVATGSTLIGGEKKQLLG